MKTKDKIKYVPDERFDLCGFCYHISARTASSYGRCLAEVRNNCERCENSSRYVYYAYVCQKRRTWARTHGMKAFRPIWGFPKRGWMRKQGFNLKDWKDGKPYKEMPF